MSKRSANFPHNGSPEATPPTLPPWHACAMQTLADLHLAQSRRRPLSLPALLRLFDRRWHDASCENPSNEAAGRTAGRDFLTRHYLARQPFSSQSNP